MGDLLNEIQILSPKAADVLKQEGFETDSDIQSLTREDLHDLLRGAKDFKLRKNVFEMIQKLRSPNMPQKELGELLNDLASSAHIDPGVLMDHNRFIDEQLLIVQLLLDDTKDLQKKIYTGQPDSKAVKGAVMGDLLKEIQIMSPEAADALTRDWETFEASEMSPSPAMDSSPHLGGSQAVSGSEGTCNSSVKYKMVVGGQTFGAHAKLMDQVKRATKGDIRLLENPDDSQIIIVFCPITSRVESDVKAAMTGVPGDKPVILVKMHHVCESKSSLCFNTSIDDRNIVLQVNVFYHVDFPGLLKCTLNDTAVYEIQQELLKYSVHRSTETRESTSGLSPDWAKTKLPSFSWYRGRK